MSQVTERSCRMCGGDLESILNLGDLQISTFLAPGDPRPPAYPLDLCACMDCSLVQLRHTVAPDLLFRHYWYLSGINEVMREELASVVESAKARVPLAASDLVIDIGANDGTLLAAYPTNIYRLAFEPAKNLLACLRPHTDILVPTYFPEGLAQAGLLPGQRAKIITSIACFYDLDDPRAFVQAIASILDPKGVWVVQFQDWHQMQKVGAFDNLVHEHLIYYSLASFERLITPLGLHVTDAELRAINGGSYRLYVQHLEIPVSPAVEALRHLEAECESWDTFASFAWRAEQARLQIRSLVDDLSHRGRILDLYGASTKWQTLAQWVGIGYPDIRQAIERSPEKWGRRTLTGIPIVNEVEGRMDSADVWIIGIWQHRAHILRREAAYLDHGGQMLFPLPQVEIVQTSRRTDVQTSRRLYV